jgi:hypothetical protein
VAAQGSELDVLEALGPCSPSETLKEEVPDVHVAATCTLQVAGMCPDWPGKFIIFLEDGPIEKFRFRAKIA